MAKYYVHEIPEGYEARIEGNKVIIELREAAADRIRKEIISALKWANHRGIYDEHISYLENLKPSFRKIHDSIMWDRGLRAGIELGKRKEPLKDFIDDFPYSCEQEEQKPVEIDEEINRWMGCEAFPEGTNITPLPQAMEIVERTAKHFSELGFELGKKTVPSPGGYWEGFERGVRECQDKIRDVKDTMKEQEPINESNMHEPTPDEARKWNEAYEKGYSLGYENGRNEQKSVSQEEWNDGKSILEDIIVFVSGYADKRVVTKWVSFLKAIRPQPKPEWSEEDEQIAKEIEEELWYPGNFPDYPSKEENELYDDCQRRLNWFKDKLKSLRPQPKQETE